MSEMVERVARAMWEERRRHAKSLDMDLDLEEWGDGSIPKANNIIGEARAAIKAMREPTGGMCMAGEASGFLHFSPEPGEGLDEIDMETAWRTMIDEALK